MRVGEGLDALLQPRSIAIIGASEDPTKIGGRPLHLLRRYGYAGPIYPINPRAAECRGCRPIHRDGSARGTGSRRHGGGGRKGAGGGQGLRRARRARRRRVLLRLCRNGRSRRGAAGRLRAAGRRTGMRMLGPNCLGAVSVADKSIATFSIVLEDSLPAAGTSASCRRAAISAASRCGWPASAASASAAS